MKIPEIQTIWAPEEFDARPNIRITLAGTFIFLIASVFEYMGIILSLKGFGLGLIVCSLILILAKQYFIRKKSSKNG